jgi:sulfofructose kinase
MREPPFDVVGVGINSVDYVAVVPAFPLPAGPMSKVRLRAYETQCGGQTATAMVACARLGLHAKYVGAVGSDVGGRLVREALSAAGVDVSSLAIHEAATRFAVILIDERTGERAVLWDFDERLKLRDDELPPAALRSARLVHVDDVDARAAIAAARIARAHDRPVTSDIDQVTDETGELVETVSVAIFAEHVPEQLARRLAGPQPRPADARLHGGNGQRGLRESLLALPRLQGQIFVVTLGQRGALALDEDGFHHQPAYRVKAVDTTGAGDVFRAGFIYAFLGGKPVDDQLRYGNAAAAVSCTRRGAMASAPTLEEVEEMLGRRGKI